MSDGKEYSYRTRGAKSSAATDDETRIITSLVHNSISLDLRLATCSSTAASGTVSGCS